MEDFLKFDPNDTIPEIIQKVNKNVEIFQTRQLKRIEQLKKSAEHVRDMLNELKYLNKHVIPIEDPHTLKN